MKPDNRSNNTSRKLFLLALILVLGPFLCENAIGRTNNLQQLFALAQADPSLRATFVELYRQQAGLPDHVLEISYSEQVEKLAISHPLIRTEKGNYRTTSHALAIGRGYPSKMTFGPKMFHSVFRYGDFHNVVQHEAAHAKFWATGKLNFLDDVDISENSKVRLRGLFPILFELDAIKTQMNHSSWSETSQSYRGGQEAYRKKWLNKVDILEKQPFMYDLKPLFERIHRVY
jgi:hypothetical protein